jgi:hypothetical protein
MNKHARKELTDSTLNKLAMLLRSAGNRNSEGGIPIVVPADVAEHIHALAWDANQHIARKAVLGAPITTIAESNDRVVMEQHPNWDGPRYAKPPVTP